MKSLNHRLQTFGSNIWIATLFQVINSSYQEKLSIKSLAIIMNHLSLILSLFPPPNPALMFQGLAFAPPTRGSQESPNQAQAPSMTNVSSYLTLERVKRLNSLEVLRARTDRDMEEFFSQLRVPRTKILNLEKPLNLEFSEPVQEIVIIQIPLGLADLGLKVSTLNPMKEENLLVKLTSPSKKKKVTSLIVTSNPMGKGKEIVLEILQPPQCKMKNCIV
ncbi:hypothetical protein FXO37_35813 [Capsicum annuum]|nr:hypothetical protein FXO37_35813 [Capsicum annuum]